MIEVMRKPRVTLTNVAILYFALAALACGWAEAQDVAEFEKRMTEFTLDNGLKFLVLERHEVPVVSFHIHADVGSVDEVKGITGLAHLFEHMAFKGTKTIGTKDYQAEAEAMAKMDKLFEAIKAERRKTEPDQAHLEELQKQFEKAQDEAQKYIEHDEYEDVYQKEGCSYFNAFTGQDYTCYIVSLPSNKIELWMSLESDRFANPVGTTISKEIENLYVELIEGLEPEKVTPRLDRIIRIRAIQDFFPSQAIAFVFLLKKAIRDEMQNEILENQLSQELSTFESRIDDLALLAFDIYMNCREKLYDIRVNETKKQMSRLLQKTGMISEIPGNQSSLKNEHET